MSDSMANLMPGLMTGLMPDLVPEPKKGMVRDHNNIEYDVIKSMNMVFHMYMTIDF